MEQEPTNHTTITDVLYQSVAFMIRHRQDDTDFNPATLYTSLHLSLTTLFSDLNNPTTLESLFTASNGIQPIEHEQAQLRRDRGKIIIDIKPDQEDFLEDYTIQITQLENNTFAIKVSLLDEPYSRYITIVDQNGNILKYETIHDYLPDKLPGIQSERGFCKSVVTTFNATEDLLDIYTLHFATDGDEIKLIGHSKNNILEVNDPKTGIAYRAIFDEEGQIRRLYAHVQMGEKKASLTMTAHYTIISSESRISYHNAITDTDDTELLKKLFDLMIRFTPESSNIDLRIITEARQWQSPIQFNIVTINGTPYLNITLRPPIRTQKAVHKLPSDALNPETPVEIRRETTELFNGTEMPILNVQYGNNSKLTARPSNN